MFSVIVILAITVFCGYDFEQPFSLPKSSFKLDKFAFSVFELAESKCERRN